MELLSDKDREFILRQLRSAPDSVLADAMLEFNLIRDKLVAVRKLTKELPEVITSEMTITEPAPNIEINPLASGRPNINPGKPSIGKMGTSTKDKLVASLNAGNEIDLNMYGEHLKLMWSRDEVKFDGARYYL